MVDVAVAIAIVVGGGGGGGGGGVVAHALLRFSRHGGGVFVQIHLKTWQVIRIPKSRSSLQGFEIATAVFGGGHSSLCRIRETITVNLVSGGGRSPFPRCYNKSKYIIRKLSASEFYFCNFQFQ